MFMYNTEEKYTGVPRTHLRIFQNAVKNQKSPTCSMDPKKDNQIMVQSTVKITSYMQQPD